MKEDNEPHVEDRFAELLTNSLSPAERTATEQHIARCVSCQEAFLLTRQVWDSLGKMNIPQPSAGMRAGFYDILETFKEEEESRKQVPFYEAWIDKLKKAAVPQWTLQLGFSLLLVVLGWAIGYRMNPPVTDQPEAQIDRLALQVQDMKSAMMLALIDNPSAAERLRAVSYTSEITNADERVLDALFTTLNNDSNVNVRLVTLEALAQYAGSAEVRKRLVQSLPQQESPLVQAALADLMVQLQEKSSVTALRALLRKQDLDDLVKTKVEQSIRDLS